MERKLTLQEKVQAFIKRQPRTSGKTVSIIIAVLAVIVFGAGIVGNALNKNATSSVSEYDGGKLVKGTVVGDMMLGRSITNKGSKNNYKNMFSGVSDLWKDSDYVAGNLECVLLDNASDYEKNDKEIHINAETKTANVLKENGFTLREVPRTKTYDEYKEMGKAFLNITYNPAAIEAGRYLEKKLGQKHLYLPLSYGFDEIEKTLDTLCENLGIEKIDFSSNKQQALDALKKAKEVIGDTPIEIDYTLTLRPASLARLLLENGFNVVAIYEDCFAGEEEEDFKWIQENYPNLKIYATVHVKMRFVNRKRDEKLLALGQKAAYFTGSNNFVNIIEGGGMYGFSGIIKLCDLMIDAFLNEKDMKKLIQFKGLGCENYETNCK